VVKVNIDPKPLAGYANMYLGCNARINGFLEIWRGMDAYLINVDQALCSLDCPCYLTNRAAYANNGQIAPYYNQWVLTSQNYDAVAFQNCTSSVKNNAYENAKVNDPDFDPNGDFNQANFADYMARIENQFECTGWCNINYINKINGQDMRISKYLFTNINRGPPMDRGCYYKVANWIIPYLIAWGTISLVIVGFQVYFS
jgi:hypothetical protein